MALTRRLVKGQAITAAEHDANIDHFEQNPNGISIPKAANVGIKVDESAPDWGWADVLGYMVTFADDLDRALIVSYVGNIKALQFPVGKQAFTNFHIPHDYAVGTDVYVHIHWSHTSATLTTGAPTFLIDGTYAKGHNQAAFGMPLSLTVSENASTTQYQHMITEEPISAALGAGGLIDSNNLEPDGLIMLRVSTATNTMDGGAEPFIHFVDLHYQTTGVATKQKAPNFYV